MKIIINKGFTLFEMIIVISFIILLAMIAIPSLSSFRKEQALKNTTDDIISLLDKAQSDTQISKNSTTYGVHFETNRAVYFVGSSFSEPNANNIQIDFDSTVNIPSGGLSLNGGGSDVVFARLTGDTIGYGTIIVSLVSDATKQKTITINKTGIISSN